MDEIDIALSSMLMVNSRIAYKDLADTFNMSVNSIHKRIKSLVELGIIKNFRTTIGPPYFKQTINVIMYGMTSVKDKKDLIEKLGSNEYIYNVIQASGNLIYIHAYIRNLAELDSLVSFVREAGEISSLNVGLDKNSPSIHGKEVKEFSLSPLDYRIIYALKKNSRRPITEIADELGYSTKTIRRHLDDLIKNSLIHFTIDWYPDKTADIFSIFIIKWKQSIQINETEYINQLRRRYGQKLVLPWTFTNLPELMLLLFWTQSMKELQKIENDLMEADFESINVTVLVEGKIFPTWIDQYLEDKIKEIGLSKD
ncbi:MAG: winged helix-turn-helix transcriptional regulator [Promethearchaeota archaeon]